MNPDGRVQRAGEHRKVTARQLGQEKGGKGGWLASTRLYQRGDLASGCAVRSFILEGPRPLPSGR